MSPLNPTFLLRSASAAGTALLSEGGGIYGGGTGHGLPQGSRLLTFECSGNSASADLLVCVTDPATPRWLSATSWALGVNQTATAQITAHFPLMVMQLNWVSAGSRTAVVNAWLAGTE